MVCLNPGKYVRPPPSDVTGRRDRPTSPAPDAHCAHEHLYGSRRRAPKLDCGPASGDKNLTAMQRDTIKFYAIALIDLIITVIITSCDKYASANVNKSLVEGARVWCVVKQLRVGTFPNKVVDNARDLSKRVFYYWKCEPARAQRALDRFTQPCNTFGEHVSPSICDAVTTTDDHDRQESQLELRQLGARRSNS
ncbi:hypothetical protein EVAR_36943_1 [Eumeta japonica]|uniref:Uncharacterized protein n=1 Tax=Eumeta variegata TaxID=151549 RepID=A0A4C1X5N2_EUMVA|nr:hypothetical protein EVAR_36943_1 [Eumeta japonica]